MGTAKRERQKANRQIRLEELAREARKDKSKKVAMRVTIGVIAFVAIVGTIYLVGRGSGSTSAATTTSVLDSTGSTFTTVAGASTTADPNVPTSVLAKPKVAIPTVIPTTLKVTSLIDGTGAGAAAGDTITVNYVGVLSADGTEFDSSFSRNQPFTFQLGEGSVIKGWDQGLIGAKVGSRVQLDIPSDLAYGTTGKGSIKPNAALTFVIDVLALTPLPTTATS